MKNIKRIVLHISVPIIISILMFFISILFIFRIPAPGYGLHPATYLFGIILAFGTLAVSSIISVILYVAKK